MGVSHSQPKWVLAEKAACRNKKLKPEGWEARKNDREAKLREADGAPKGTKIGELLAHPSKPQCCQVPDFGWFSRPETAPKQP